MLSKEEIENENRKHIKEVLTEYKDYIFEFDATNLCIADILEYIEQLETDKQKLIEKLENNLSNIKKEKLPEFKTVTELIRYKGYAEGRIESYNGIISILKGKNHE